MQCIQMYHIQTKVKKKNSFALCRAFQSNLLIVSAVTERCALQVFLINS